MASLFSDHVSDDVWADYLEDRTAPAVTARIRKHLETGCDTCNRQFGEWQRLLGALERSRTPVPPSALLAQAFNLFDTFTPQPSVWDRIVAHLVFDSRRDPLPVGVRSAAGTAFHLRFDTPEANISLWCESDASKRWIIRGQVQPMEAYWSITAKTGGSEISADLNDSGEFRLPDLMAGRCDLTLRGLEQEVVIPGIELDLPGL